MKNKKFFELKSETPRLLGRPLFESAPVQQIFDKLMDPEWVAEFNKKDVEKNNKPAR